MRLHGFAGEEIDRYQDLDCCSGDLVRGLGSWTDCDGNIFEAEHTDDLTRGSIVGLYFEGVSL